MREAAELHILVVDDSKYIRVWLRGILSTAGYNVICVEPRSAFDVLSAIHDAKPDLVISDYEMPDCNGESLLRLMREDPHFRDTPVLIYSAHGEEELVVRMGQYALVGYVVKPVSPEDLLGAVKRALNRAGGG